MGSGELVSESTTYFKEQIKNLFLLRSLLIKNELLFILNKVFYSIHDRPL